MPIQPPQLPAGEQPPSPGDQAPLSRLAVASLALGIAGCLVGLYVAAFHSGDVATSYTGGAPPLAYRVLWWVALPSGVVGAFLGVLALQLTAANGAQERLGLPRRRGRELAVLGLILGGVATFVAVGGIADMFFEMAGPD